jgi:UDP-glucose 4-epimerase
MAVCLVTGGAGFIGSHLVETLVEQGHTVRVLDNFSTGTAANLARVRDRITVVTGDLIAFDVVRDVTRGAELVFHLAAPPYSLYGHADPLATHQAGSTGTLHVLIAARDANVRRVVYASSSTVYGHAPGRPLAEQHATQPLSPYAAAKLAGEHDCAAFTYLYGLDTVRLRYFNVFGPRQHPSGPYGQAILLILRQMLAGHSPVLRGDGLDHYDFSYVDDVVYGTVLAAEAPRVAGRAYNIARGRPTTLLEVVATVNSLLGTQILPTHSQGRQQDDLHNLAAIARAEAELGFCPATDLGQGLRKCLDYYRSARDLAATPG